jgi:tRNA threonylcarbamoyladenosine biosynthesis protein TsaE
MEEYITRSTAETEELGSALAESIIHGQKKHGCVIALYGGLGMGKTAFVRGLASGLGLDAEVSSPTFALVHEYGGQPPLVHFDMYRVSGWDDLTTTGYFDYLDGGALLAVEWSERIENALPPDAVRVRFERLSDDGRRILIENAPALHPAQKGGYL